MAAMELDVGTILKDVFSNYDKAMSCMDDDTLSYMEGIVTEELQVQPKGLSADAICDLFGSFLLDAGCSDEAVTLKICADVSNRLSPAIIPPDDQDNIEDAADVVKVSLKSLLGDADSGYEDPFLGLTKANVNFNSAAPIADAIKRHKALQKEKEAVLRRLREWEKEKLPLPPPVRLHGTVQLQKVTDVCIDRFSIAVAGRELLCEAPLKLSIGRKYGLVGRNGIGKSTFLGGLVRREIVGVPQDLSIGCIEQDLVGDNRTALEAVLAVDVEQMELLKEEKLLLNAPDTDVAAGKRLTWIYNRLQAIDSGSAEAQASSILAGIGFSVEMQHLPTRLLSGGWRMRVALSRALFSDPDILCLDEPTNHLDLNAVAWLTDYLQNSPKTCILVSHARNFLNDVCTDIIHFKDQTLKYYKGDYDTFEKVKGEQDRLQQKSFDAQQKKRDHVQTFIDRFRYNAKRAAIVQSRIKALEKLPMLEAVAADPLHAFNFSDTESLGGSMLRLQDVGFSYDGKDAVDHFLFKDVCMDINAESRIAVCGVNGSGKSTLIKLLVGLDEPVLGTCTKNSRLRIGYFCQHHVDGLDLSLNSVQQLQAKFPEADLKPEDARNHLGKFGITGLLGLEPLYILSGGQKSRVAIALMAFNEPHLLVLDEPTNHLDLEAVQALIVALNNFKGGVIIVSHDAHLLQCVVDEVWHVEPELCCCTKFSEDFETYRKQLLQNKI